LFYFYVLKKNNIHVMTRWKVASLW